MFPSSYSNILLDHHTCGDNEMFVTNYYNENPNYLSSPDELVAPNLANSKDHEEVIDEEDGLILSELLSHKTERCSEVISYCNINNKEKEKVVSHVTTTNSSKRKKGRHSKICTAQGTRDRRMRLSLQIARKFFDLQDMLGFDKASQTIEWLFSKSKSAIKDLKDSFSPPGAPKNIQVDDDRQKGEQSVLLKEEKILRKSSRKVVKESRDKARERARERTREKLKAKMVIEQQPHLQATNNHDQLLEDDGILRMKEQFLGILRAERSFLEQNGANSEDDFLGFSQNSDFLHNYSSSCFCCPAETNVKQPSQLNVEIQNPNSIFLDTSSSRSDEKKNDTPNFSNNNNIPFYSQTQNPIPFFMNTASYNSTGAQHQNPNSSFIPSSLFGQQKQNMSTNSSSNLLLTSPSSVYLESQFIEDQFHCNYASANY